VAVPVLVVVPEAHGSVAQGAVRRAVGGAAPEVPGPELALMPLPELALVLLPLLPHCPKQANCCLSGIPEEVLVADWEREKLAVQASCAAGYPLHLHAFLANAHWLASHTILH